MNLTEKIMHPFFSRIREMLLCRTLRLETGEHTERNVFLRNIARQSGNDRPPDSFSPEKLFGQCREIRSELDPPLSWEWDGRFGMALSVFPCQEASLIKSVLSQKFLTSWNRNTYRKAPKTVRSLISQLGGLRPEQILYTSEPAGSEVILFGAWWPWENKSNISLRIGAQRIKKSKLREDNLQDELKDSFQVN